MLNLTFTATFDRAPWPPYTILHETYAATATFLHSSPLTWEQLECPGYRVVAWNSRPVEGDYQHTVEYTCSKGEGTELRKHLERVLGIEPPSAS